LPTGLGTPTGWLGSFVRVTGYADSATVSVGDGSPYPTTSASAPSGQLQVYNGSTYETFNLTPETNLQTVTRTQSISGTISGTNVTATFTLDGAQATNSSVVRTSDPGATGTLVRTDATAQVVAPVIVVRYQLSLAGTGTVLDLTTTINLGTLDLDASYAEQPEEGS